MICKRCLYTSKIPNIVFDENGICNYCHAHDNMENEYPISGKLFMKMVSDIKQDGKGKEYDCVVGFSGGCDSSYLLWKLVEKGVKPLAVHWDNNWNSETATENMLEISEQLDINIEYHNIRQYLYDDLCEAFLLGGTADIDIPNDIALTTSLYKSAEQHNLKYIINGHSFRTEGFTPLGWTYMDGKYIQSVYKKYGTYDLGDYPNLLIDDWLRWLKQGIKRIRPLYHLDYNKEQAKKELKKEFGWEWYGGHHAENRYTKFVGNYMWAKKFGIDLRYVEYSALMRSKQMSRGHAWRKIHQPLTIEPDIIEEVKTRLNLSGENFQRILDLPIKTYKNYDTYKPYFQKNKRMFKGMYEKGLIPYTFFSKYCLEE